MTVKAPCHDCEYGDRQTYGLFTQYLPPEEIPVICHCPMKINGKCTCTEDKTTYKVTVIAYIEGDESQAQARANILANVATTANCHTIRARVERVNL